MTITKTAPATATRNAYIDRDLLDPDTRALTFVASTSGVKRDGIDLKIDGIDTTNYEANPVFLWAHDYRGATLPIGKVTRIKKLKNRLDVTVEFDENDEFAQRVEQKYRDGFLNAVSIGWNILEWQRAEEGNDDGADFIVTRSDLLDVSAVPVPGDPTALMKTQRDFLTSLGRELIEMEDQSVDGAEPAVDADDDPDFGERLGAVLESIETAVERITEAVESIQPPVGEVIDFDSLVAIRDALDKETTNA